MVNDLIPLNNDNWKYVDDMSLSEIIPRNGVSNTQFDLDHISSWATDNYVKRNATKCKELRISLLRHKPNFSQLCIAGAPIEIVESANVLGVSLQNDLDGKPMSTTSQKSCKTVLLHRMLQDF